MCSGFMDPRYKFVRGGPFDGLDDYASAPVIHVKSRDLKYPIIKRDGSQRSFQDYNYQRRLKDDLAFFFELLAQGVYGGKLTEREALTPQLSIFTGKEDGFVQPDLIVKPGHYKEVKSFAPGQNAKLMDYQMPKYRDLLRKHTNSHSAPDMEFEFFRHGIRELLKNYRTKPLEELVENIAPTVNFHLSLPSRVAWKIYQADNEFSSRYEGPSFSNCTQFSSSGANAMLAYPEDTLRKLGFSPEDFEIQKRRLPENMTMNSIPILSIPILILKDRKHPEWVREFVSEENVENEPKEQPQQGPTIFDDPNFISPF